MVSLAGFARSIFRTKGGAAGRRVAVALVAVVGAAALTTVHPVRAETGAATTVSVASGQQLVNVDLDLFRFPARVRVSSGACDASGDDAVVVEGTIDGSRETTLLPVGRRATELSAGSPINAIAMVGIETVEIDNTGLRFLAFNLFVQLYRETGFPGVTSFNVCLLTS